MRGLRALVLLFLLVPGLLPRAARSQSLLDLISECGAASETLEVGCRETGLAVQAAQGALGLAASGGTDVPGSASTLGWRTKGSPRLALSLRGAVLRAPLSRAGFASSDDPAPRGTQEALHAAHLVGTVGLFDGFSLAPTVGGFASIDLTGSAHWIGTPRESGFREDLLGWGVGGRVGILRESFSLPGVSVSVFHRWLGETKLWEVDEGNAAEAIFNLRAASLRGVVGKDIGGIGFYGGLGWERYTGDAALLVPDPGAGEVPGASTGELESDRGLAFFGGSLTYIALQVSVEVGLAQGFDPDLPASEVEGLDPSTRSTFAALALRLTF